MRRLWVCAVLLAPAAAAAQAVPQQGSITFDELLRSSTDGFINAAECSGGTIALDWNVALDEGKTFPSSGGVSFTLFAANKNSDGACPIADGDKGDLALRAGLVGALSGRDRLYELDAQFATSTIAEAAGKGECNATEDEDIFLCVQAKDSSGNIGTARGKLTLSLASPRKPAWASAPFGDRALNIDWEVITGTTPEVEYYEIRAQSSDPRDSAVHTLKTARPRARLTGLVNGVTYNVKVYSLSPADNRSVDFAETTGTPQEVLDFWDLYSEDGQEQGGCGGGRAGLGSLAVLAALLAALRRRR